MRLPRLLDVRGSPRERGRAVGEALRDGIAEHLEAWHGALARGGVDEPRSYVAELLAASTFAGDANRIVPHLMDEVRGMAEGAGLGFDELFALQLIDEEWVFRASRRSAQTSRDKCSSVALRDEGRSSTWIAQNMDLGAYTDGLQLLVRHGAGDQGPAQLVFTLAGHLGLMGVNEAGVGLCCNSLPQLPSGRGGVPVAFAVRRVLEGRTAAECADIARSLTHATNQHYLIADADAVISLEACSTGVREYLPARRGRVLHTNHPLSDAVSINDTGSAHRANTLGRLASLERSLGEVAPAFEVVAAALSSLEGEHPVCRLRSDEPGLINFTTGSMITRLARDAPVEALVAFGPPAIRAYRRFDFAACEGQVA